MTPEQEQLLKHWKNDWILLVHENGTRPSPIGAIALQGSMFIEALLQAKEQQVLERAILHAEAVLVRHVMPPGSDVMIAELKSDLNLNNPEKK